MPRTDKRRSWFRKRRDQGSQRDTVDSSTLNPISNDHVDAISALQLRDLQSMVMAAASTDHVHLQVPVLEICLKRILYEMDSSSARSPRPEQVRTLRRLIFGKGRYIIDCTNRVWEEPNILCILSLDWEDYSSNHPIE